MTANGVIPTVGRDVAVMGAVSALPVGEISRPVEGIRGVFLVRVSAKTPFDSTAFAAQKDQLRNQLLSEKRNRFLSDWSTDLKKNSEIVDNREPANQ